MPTRWGWHIEDVPVTLRAPALDTQTDSSATITLVPYNCTKFRVSMFGESS